MVVALSRSGNHHRQCQTTVQTRGHPRARTWVLPQAPHRIACVPMGGMDAVVYTESVRVESKVFYIDLKQNNRGRYVKLSETGPTKPRSTIMVPACCLNWFAKLLDYYLQDTGSLVDKQLSIESKVFTFSLGENQKGRYLRITESSIGHPAGHSSVMIPSAGDDGLGWATLRDSIQRVCAIAKAPQLDEEEEAHVASSSSSVGPGPAPLRLSVGSTSAGAPVLTVGQKRFFFDVDDDDRGRQLRITEVLRQERSLLAIPSAALGLFQDALTRCISSLRGPPACAAEFGREWSRNCLTQQDKYAYLKLVSPAGLAAIFKEGLRSELLGEMLVVLEACWVDAAAGDGGEQELGRADSAALAEEATFVAQTMHALTFSGGFVLNVRQMSGSSRQAAVSVLEALRTCWLRESTQANSRHPSINAPGRSDSNHGSGPGHNSSNDRSARNDDGASRGFGARGAASAGGSRAGGSWPKDQGRDYARDSSDAAGWQGRAYAHNRNGGGGGLGGEWPGDVLLAQLWHVYVVAPQAASRLW